VADPGTERGDRSPTSAKRAPVDGLDADMISRLAGTIRTAVTVVRVANEHEIRYPAAAFAYYAFVSLLPLLVLVVAILGEAFSADIRAELPHLIAPEARALVDESLTTATGRVGATVLSVVVLAWSGSNMALDFQTVVERVEGTPEEPLVVQLRDAVSILGSFGLAVVSITLTGAFFTFLSVDPLVDQGWPLVLFVTFLVAFLPLYYLPSRAVSSLSEAFPGAIAVAVGWTVLFVIVQFFAVNAARYAIYGVLSGVIAILTSLYLATIMLMLGVVVNATLARDPDVGGSR
jgi:membrane protein